MPALGYVALIGLLAGGACLYRQAPEIAAGALLHPSRTERLPQTPDGCLEREFDGAGVTLRGWQCSAIARPRGTIVYLHGVADNRGSAAGPIARYRQRGYNVVAYDSRAHGQSGGKVCTYGFYEKQDLRRILDALAPEPIIVVGTSLGAAVALQAAAEDPRISGIVAAEVFMDLETIARDRATAFMWPRLINKALDEAERMGRFDVQAVSPRLAARNIRVPVLLLHGEADTETRSGHSVIVHAALAGPKRLILVPGAGHNQTLGNAEAWTEIDRWIDAVMKGVS